MIAIAKKEFPMTMKYPRLRFMGSKYKIIPHLHAALSGIEYESALDAFSGSGVVSYCLKEYYD